MIFQTLRRNATYNKPIAINLLVLCFLAAFFSAGLDCAYGINLTHVTHLFDITHDFSQPSDVSVAPNGDIYIVDGVNNTIKVFDQEGSFKFAFGEKGQAEGQLKQPLGIDIGPDGKVYIADSGNQRVQIFNSDGTYISQIRVPDEDGLKADPTDVAVALSIDRLFIIDNDQHNVRIYELSSLKHLQNFGIPGAEEREFRYPFLATIDKDQYIYVTDVVNTRVQVFTMEGKFVNVIGGWGVEKGRFFRPKGVAIDNKNRIYVSDGYMGVIQLFHPDGIFHSALGEPDSDFVKRFIKPMGLFIDKNNRLYVVEMFADRVRVYNIEN